MKKKLFTILIALVLLMVTVYAASALEIKEIQEKDAHVGVEFSQNVELTSYENVGDLTYTLLDNPASMTINNDGKITWTPKLADIGTHTIRVEVSNATNNDVEEFDLTVIYSAFTISLNTGSAPVSAIPEKEYKFKLQASSSHPLAVEGYNYELIDGPEGMILLNDELIWTPTISQLGSYNVRVSALPQDAPSDFNPVEGVFTVSVQGMTIDRIEVRAEGRRLETISRDNYLSSSVPYAIDREANLGDMIELRISIRNNLPTHNDNELRDVEIEIYSYDLVDADGQEAFISRIRTGRTEDQTISFYIDPVDVHPDDAPFDLEIRVTGETRAGDLLSDVWVLELRLESKSYNLLMSNIAIVPESVCAGERLRVSMNPRNIGTRDLSLAGVRYYVPELNINEWERNIVLDYDDSRTITKFFDVPKDAIPGEYFMELIAHPRMTSTSDTSTEILMFNVRSCEPVKEDEKEDTVVVVPPVQEVVVPGTPISEATGKKTSIFDKDSNVYVVLLTALIVLVLVGVILLLVAVFKK